jgi:AcrR family transcriptional regulator
LQKTRGAYAKGVAKREEILEKALTAFSKSGYLATSMREIAAACDLTQAGLLHHFPNKESLLIAIIEQREAKQVQNTLDAEDLTWQERTLRQLNINIENRTETLVFSILAAEAEDPTHPAHDYMLNRYRGARANWEKDICEMRGGKTISSEDRIKAAMITAIWDGLQLQWLLDDDFDMRAPFEYALEMISRYKRFE